ncbi:MAG: hypothetical protein GX141_01405, partial [Armatimonadetes bacterium]|nr:hypothetical protein [Armatimonadota bacterium]
MGINTRRLFIALSVCACILIAMAATPALAWWANSGEKNPTSSGGETAWAQGTSCSKTYWYCVPYYADGTARGFWAQWKYGFTYAGRGYVQQQFWRPGWFSGSTTYPLARCINQAGTVTGPTARTYSACNQGCEWITLWSGALTDVATQDGLRINANDDTHTCNIKGSSYNMIGQTLYQGDRWSYLNKWTILGPYSSTALSDTNGLDEANLYLYPYVSTGMGTAIQDGLWGGKQPVSYDAGDCNTTGSLNFGTKWN